MQRIARLLQRLRDFYRPGRPEPQRLDLTVLLEEVLALSAKHLQHSGVTVKREWPADLPVTYADAQQLKQVFLNLALNAADAMAGTDGTLRVCMAPASMPSGCADAGRPAVRVEFGDNGPGVPPEILSKMFEPFLTSKRSGTGLGLYISYGIIKSAAADPCCQPAR
jgi:two-component system NtrC family sensor kinase